MKLLLKNRIFKIFLFLGGLALTSTLIPNREFYIPIVKWRWMNEKIFHTPRQTVDFVFLGSSRIKNAVLPHFFEKEMGGETLAWNMGKTGEGRDSDFIITKKLLENHDVKNIVIEFSRKEPELPHHYSRLLFNGREAIEDLWYHFTALDPIRNFGRYFTLRNRLGWLVESIGLLAVRGWIQLPIQLLQNYGCRDSYIEGCRRQEELKGYPIEIADAKVDPNPEFAKNYPKLRSDFDQHESPPRWSSVGTRSDTYLKKIVKLAKEKGTRVWFVLVPIYNRKLPSLSTLRYFEEMGNLLIPDLEPLHRSPAYWADDSHLYKEGTEIFSRQIAQQILARNSNRVVTSN